MNSLPVRYYSLALILSCLIPQSFAYFEVGQSNIETRERYPCCQEKRVVVDLTGRYEGYYLQNFGGQLVLAHNAERSALMNDVLTLRLDSIERTGDGEIHHYTGQRLKF